MKIEIKKVYDIQAIYQYKNLSFHKHPLICTDIKTINGKTIYEFFLAQTFKPNDRLSKDVWIVLYEITDNWPGRSTKINFNQKISIEESQLKHCFVCEEYKFYNGKVGHTITDEQLTKIKHKWLATKQNHTNITLIQNIQNKEVYFYEEGTRYAYNTFPHLRNPDIDKLENRPDSYKERYFKYKQTDKIK